MVVILPPSVTFIHMFSNHNTYNNLILQTYNQEPPLSFKYDLMAGYPYTLLYMLDNHRVAPRLIITYDNDSLSQSWPHFHSRTINILKVDICGQAITNTLLFKLWTWQLACNSRIPNMCDP